MRSSHLIASLTAFAASAQALPDSALFQRAACNRDDCLRQIVANAFPGGNARGSAGCSSFQTTTVTPCPVTSTITAPTSTVTVTVTTPSTTTSVTTSTTLTTSITATTTTTTAVVNKKRDIIVLPDAIRYVKPGVTVSHIAQKRAVTPTCSASSIKSTFIPTYASSCRSPSQYASACSCNGIPASTRTLAPVTVSSTTTPITTKTVTATSVVTVTSTTITTSTTLTTTTSTTTSTSTSTTTTAAPAGPTCSRDATVPQVQQNCPNGSTCNAISYQCTGTTNSDQCFNFCLNDPACIEGDYYNGGTCYYYDDCCGGN